MAKHRIVIEWDDENRIYGGLPQVEINASFGAINSLDVGYVIGYALHGVIAMTRDVRKQYMELDAMECGQLMKGINFARQVTSLSDREMVAVTADRSHG